MNTQPHEFETTRRRKTHYAEIEALMARVTKPTGSFGYDALGYNEDTTKLAVAAWKLEYDQYFRVATASSR